MRAAATTLLATLLVGCGSARAVDGRRCSSEQACATVHPPGIADQQSADFHGTLVKSLGWNLDTCADCHGADFSGGKSGVSCRSCHVDGPTACTVCHDQPPATGAHLAHARKLDCTACHVKPMLYTDVGHLFDANGKVIAKAQVTFGALAAQTPHTADRPGPPRFADGQCDNVYCHGGAFADNAASNRTPRWDGGPDAAACGTCHGLPPSDHVNGRCVECHARVVDGNRTIIGEALHVDGKVSLGDDSSSCTACHPNPGGAHESHTQALHRLRAPLGCPECHVPPTSVDSPGHIDRDRAAVFPSGWSGLGGTDGARPSWDGARCSDVYCHGGGQTLSLDGATSIQRQPTWIAGSGAADCGACHGIPPVDAAHTPAPTLAECARCHPSTIDASFSLIPGGTHLDGVINHVP
jgi:predicted CxxxxCH...CXXCH cytochrome family protein